MKYAYEVMRHYDGTEIMMMSITNIEGSSQDSEYKDQVEVMMSLINKIKYTERENDTVRLRYVYLDTLALQDGVMAVAPCCEEVSIYILL